MADSNFRGSTPAGYISGAAILINRACKLDSTEGRVVPATAIADVFQGVALTACTAAGQTVSLQKRGKAKMVASAAIALGAQVMITASGAGKISTAAGATAHSIGQALQAAGADGDVIEVDLDAVVNQPPNA